MATTYLATALEAAKQILEEKPTIRIIIASADDSVEKQVHDSGLYFLQKPFSIDSLGKLIESAIDQDDGLEVN